MYLVFFDQPPTYPYPKPGGSGTVGFKPELNQIVVPTIPHHYATHGPMDNTGRIRLRRTPRTTKQIPDVVRGQPPGPHERPLPASTTNLTRPSSSDMAPPEGGPNLSSLARHKGANATSSVSRSATPATTCVRVGTSWRQTHRLKRLSMSQCLGRTTPRTIRSTCRGGDGASPAPKLQHRPTEREQT